MKTPNKIINLLDSKKELNPLDRVIKCANLNNSAELQLALIDIHLIQDLRTIREELGDSCNDESKNAINNKELYLNEITNKALITSISNNYFKCGFNQNEAIRCFDLYLSENRDLLYICKNCISVEDNNEEDEYLKITIFKQLDGFPGEGYRLETMDGNDFIECSDIQSFITKSLELLISINDKSEKVDKKIFNIKDTIGIPQ